MAIRFRKQAIKFIEKADSETLSRIQDKLNQLLIAVKSKALRPDGVVKMKGFALVLY